MKILYFTRKLRKSLWTFLNGIWSGIPLCCILFYVKQEYNGIKNIAFLTAKKRRIEVESTTFGTFRYLKPSKNISRYVQCEKCFRTKKIVKLKYNGFIFNWIQP